MGESRNTIFDKSGLSGINFSSTGIAGVLFIYIIGYVEPVGSEHPNLQGPATPGNRYGTGPTPEQVSTPVLPRP